MRRKAWYLEFGRVQPFVVVWWLSPLVDFGFSVCFTTSGFWLTVAAFGAGVRIGISDCSECGGIKEFVEVKGGLE